MRATYEYGLINGQSDTRFAPDSALTVAEAIKLAACLHSIYHTGSADFTESQPWCQTYVCLLYTSAVDALARRRAREDRRGRLRDNQTGLI